MTNCFLRKFRLGTGFTDIATTLRCPVPVVVSFRPFKDVTRIETCRYIACVQATRLWPVTVDYSKCGSVYEGVRTAYDSYLAITILVFAKRPQQAFIRVMFRKSLQEPFVTGDRINLGHRRSSTAR